MLNSQTTLQSKFSLSSQPMIVLWSYLFSSILVFIIGAGFSISQSVLSFSLVPNDSFHVSIRAVAWSCGLFFTNIVFWIFVVAMIIEQKKDALHDVCKSDVSRFIVNIKKIFLTLGVIIGKIGILFIVFYVIKSLELDQIIVFIAVLMLDLFLGTFFLCLLIKPK